LAGFHKDVPEKNLWGDCWYEIARMSVTQPPVSKHLSWHIVKTFSLLQAICSLDEQPCLPYFDNVGWASRRASSMYKISPATQKVYCENLWQDPT